MESQQNELVWLITGAGSGLGRELALQALARSEKVIATGRAQSIKKLDDLKEKGAEVLELDVISPLETLHEIAKKAASLYGRIDVLVNNAGYFLSGAVENVTPQDTYDHFNTNILGALNVTRAVLPHMRQRKTGTIVWPGSLYGWTGVPCGSIYIATKWALRGISLSLNAEIAPLGLRSICIDFGTFRTGILEGDRRIVASNSIPDYEEISNHMETLLQAVNGNQPGDPVKGVQAVIDVVRGEGKAKGKPFPTELLLGTDCYSLAKEETEKSLKQIEEWKDFTCSTDF